MQEPCTILRDSRHCISSENGFSAKLAMHIIIQMRFIISDPHTCSYPKLLVDNKDQNDVYFFLYTGNKCHITHNIYKPDLLTNFNFFFI